MLSEIGTGVLFVVAVMAALVVVLGVVDRLSRRD